MGGLELSESFAPTPFVSFVCVPPSYATATTHALLGTSMVGRLLCSGRESSWRCSTTLPVRTLKIGADPLRWYRGARSGVPEEDDDVADANTGPPSV